MRNIITRKLFFFSFSAVFLFLQGCINMSKQEAADKPVGKQVVDSTANYLIKVNYPAEPQDKEEVMKKKLLLQTLIKLKKSFLTSSLPSS